MEEYTVKITQQAIEHLSLIRDYIANELQQPIIAKKIVSLLKEK